MATKAKPAPVEEDEAELEELDTDAEATDDKPAAKAAVDHGFGVRQLIALIKEKTEKEYSPREVRTLLRKLARSENAVIDREIVAGNKSRYVWDGPADPEVKAVLKAVKGGAIEAAKKEALDKLKSDKAQKTAAAGDKPKGKKKAAAAPEADDEDEDDD